MKTKQKQKEGNITQQYKRKKRKENKTHQKQLKNKNGKIYPP